MSEQQRLINKVLAKEPLSSDEAAWVWGVIHYLFRDNGLSAYRPVYDQLQRELIEGERCGVCGKYDSDDCMEGC